MWILWIQKVSESDANCLTKNHCDFKSDETHTPAKGVNLSWFTNTHTHGGQKSSVICVWHAIRHSIIFLNSDKFRSLRRSSEVEKREHIVEAAILGAVFWPLPLAFAGFWCLNATVDCLVTLGKKCVS